MGFSWDERILPHGFFFTAAIELLSMPVHSVDDYNFQLCTKESQWLDEISVHEKHGKIPGIVKLTNRTSWIQVSTSSGKEYCLSIRKAVDAAIEKAVERFKHTGIDSPRPVSLCPHHPSSYHYCNITPNRKNYTCSEDKLAGGSVTTEMSCWITGIHHYSKLLEV